MTIKQNSKSDHRSYVEEREAHPPKPKDRSERNFKNNLRKMDFFSVAQDDSDLPEWENEWKF